MKRVALIVSAAVVVVTLIFGGAFLSKAGAMDWLVGGTYSKKDMRDEYDRGKSDGDSTGYNRGWSEGNADGYSRGMSAGCREVFEKIKSETGYDAITAWDTYWNRTRGSYYYTQLGTCD